MKKAFAIFLNLLLLFNFIGYRVLIAFLQQKAAVQVQKRISETAYVEGELKTISVPLNIPYQKESSEFEQIEGEMQICGITYHYVKRKISHGKLILKCLPDEEKERLKNSADAYFNLVNGIDKYPEKGSPLASAVKKVFTFFALNEQKIPAASVVTGKVVMAREQKAFLPFLPQDVPGKPPERI